MLSLRSSPRIRSSPSSPPRIKSSPSSPTRIRGRALAALRGSASSQLRRRPPLQQLRRLRPLRQLQRRVSPSSTAAAAFPSQKCRKSVKVLQIVKAKNNADNTRDSQAVPHPSTNRAQRCLTWQIGRDAVLSTWYGRQRTQGRRP